MVLTLPRDMDELKLEMIANFCKPSGDKLKVLAFVLLSQEANIDINKR